MKTPENKTTAQDIVETSPPDFEMHPRRRLIKGGLLGASVVMATLASRPAFAHTCKTPSAFGSMNASRPVPVVECGYSPGYWKSKPGVTWPIPPTTPFNTVFTAGLPAQPATLTLMQALEMGGGGLIAFRRHIIAALLNQRSGVTADFLTEAEIKGMWAAASTGGTYVNPTRGISWTPAQVMTYIQSLYQ
ncbi:MAG TPA: hypothetical protein PLW86_05995 [Rhodocyclaceae bacterium]|nr:hypothetical protein [Rhodocyclaceae bacterium]